MGFGFAVKEFPRTEISDGQVEQVEESVLQDIEDKKAFGQIQDRGPTDFGAKELQMKFDYWLMGVQGTIPEDFMKIVKRRM